jgi:hypothetical protein
MNQEFDKDLSIEVVRTKRRKTASIKVIDGLVQEVIPVYKRTPGMMVAELRAT